MQYEIYSDIAISEDLSIFEFTSVGKRGLISKRIEFTPTHIPGFYNLALGDITCKNELDDFSTTDNGDRNKVLATVAYAVEEYLKEYPDRWIYFRGSTRERTRLYRMAIGLHLEELSHKYEIYAQTNNGLIRFRKNVEIEAIVFKVKNLSICYMKQRVIKTRSELFNREVTLVIDERLNKLIGTVQFPKKLEEANKSLLRLKEKLPK